MLNYEVHCMYTYKQSDDNYNFQVVIFIVLYAEVQATTPYQLTNWYSNLLDHALIHNNQTK